MSGKIQRYASDVAMPLTKTKNQLKFNINQESGQIDMNSSYLELELNIVDSTGAQVTDLNDVVLGRDDVMYGPTCIIRDSKLYGTKSGKKYQDLNYVNILMQNLNYWTQGKNEIKANTLWNGMGAKVQDGSVLSIFNNTYSDDNPTLRIPLKELYPGSVGNSDMLPVGDEDLTFTYFLEPYYRILQSLTESDYVPPVQAVAGAQPAVKAFTSGGQANSILTPAAVGQLNGYAQGQYVSVPAGDAFNIFKITTLTPDAGQTVGSITLDGLVAVGAVNLGTVYPANMITTAGTVACNDIAGNGQQTITQVTVTTPAEAPIVGQTVQISYYMYVPGMVSTDFTKLQQSAYVKVTNVQAGVVTLSGTIYGSTLAAGSTLYGVTLDKLSGQNLDTYDWQVVNAHLVLYRRNVPMVPNKNMLVSNFESMNVQIAGGLNKFFYTFLTDKSCYNAYAFIPTGDNLYSQAQNIGKYQFSVDGKPLTSLYMDTSTSLHNDNMLRVLSNSPYYPCKNLNQDRDDEEAPNPTTIDPIMYPAKVYQAMLKGEPVVNSEAGRTNLKLELLPTTGQTTPAANVYLFCEKYQEL